jgi:hypothetical protein
MVTFPVVVPVVVVVVPVVLVPVVVPVVPVVVLAQSSTLRVQSTWDDMICM